MNNMANMAGMGGPVNAPMNMMNNVAPQAQQRHGPGPDGQHRTLLNTYIYEYFIRSGMWDCARAVLNADSEINVKKQSPGHSNGLGDDPMDTDSKDLLDKRPDDLPAPNVPMAVTDSCFLFDWFSLFWTMFSHQKVGGHTGQVVNQYVQHTQAQSRLKQEQQRDLLRNMRPDAYNQQQYQQHMLRMQNGAMNMGVKPGNNLQRAAMANNQNPQTMQMLQQNKVAGQMQRDPSDMEGNRVRPGSPASAENAPSPSKRPRLDSGAPFNPQAGVMMPNGRPQGMPGQQQVGNGPDSARALLLQNGINPTQLNPDQLQAFISASPHVQAKSLATYSANLQQHHGNQMPNKPMANAVGPQGQGSPMVPQGPDAPTLNQYYNPNEMGPGAMRPVQGNGQATGGSNHALQDYQMQLMLLEQQNKKRLMMARQEQDMGSNNIPRPDGPPGGPPGPNAQGFQQGTSPPGGRNGASPNPEQMKRAQQLNNAANMGGSPLPDGAVQSRSSPNAMNFMDGNGMVPNGGPQFMNMQMNGAGMRPPNSHPNQPFNPQLAHQQMMAQRQGQGMQGPGGMQWQPGPNGQLPGQGPPPQVQGTPTQAQRTMGPPSAPNAAANAANSRNATSSPQVSTAAPPTPQAGNKPAPKKKETKNSKAKTAQKKTNNNLNNTAATPAGDDNAQEAPTPATPITPSNPANFAKNQNINAGPVVPNGQPAVQQPPPQGPPVAAPQHQDPNLYMDAGALDPYPLGFADPTQSNDVLNDFDFDSFLHDGNNGDDGVGNFDFGGTAFGMEDGTNTIGTAD